MMMKRSSVSRILITSVIQRLIKVHFLYPVSQHVTGHLVRSFLKKYWARINDETKPQPKVTSADCIVTCFTDYGFSISLKISSYKYLPYFPAANVLYQSGE